MLHRKVLNVGGKRFGGVVQMDYQRETVALISHPSSDPASVWLFFLNWKRKLKNSLSNKYL